MSLDPPSAAEFDETPPFGDDAPPRRTRREIRLARVQGVFFIVTGVWPLLHLRSFLRVTGPKVDVWLVQTLGAALAVAGVSLLVASHAPRISGAWKFLAWALALVLATSDIVFGARGVIPPVYFADAAIEIVFAIAWSATFAGGRRSYANS